MKKQQKSKQQNKKKQKKPITFEERFKDKKNVVGKLGVLDLLGLHQPFNLQRPPSPILQVSQQQQQQEEVNVNPQKPVKYKRKLSLGQIPVSKSNVKQFKAHKTDQIKSKLQNKVKSEKDGLPRISKSTGNILLIVNTKQGLTTKQYWKCQNNPPLGKKRSTSQISMISMLRNDIQANQHLKNLARFEAIQKNIKKSQQKKQIKIKNI